MSRLARRPGLQAALLCLPLVLFLAVFFVLPMARMVASSFASPEGPTLRNYARFLDNGFYAATLLTTMEVALATAVLAAVLGYPVALVIVRGPAWMGRAITAIIIAPLVVNIVTRTYGWKVILANSRSGVLNWALSSLGLVEAPLRLLYTEAAVVIGTLHLYLPLMVLPLAAALTRINPEVEAAARTLGASPWAVFRRVTLPLSLPGLGAGMTLVFSLTASAFISPAILGGNFVKMLGTLVEEQILSVFDWNFGAAIATVLMVAVLAVNLAYIRLIDSRLSQRRAA